MILSEWAVVETKVLGAKKLMKKKPNYIMLKIQYNKRIVDIWNLKEKNILESINTAIICVFGFTNTPKEQDSYPSPVVNITERVNIHPCTCASRRQMHEW